MSRPRPWTMNSINTISYKRDQGVLWENPWGGGFDPDISEKKLSKTTGDIIKKIQKPTPKRCHHPMIGQFNNQIISEMSPPDSDI